MKYLEEIASDRVTCWVLAALNLVEITTGEIAYLLYHRDVHPRVIAGGIFVQKPISQLIDDGMKPNWGTGSQNPE